MSESDQTKKEIYMRLRTLDEQAQQLNGHIESIDQQLSELASSIQIMSEFSQLKPGAELKVPLTSGVYLEAKLDNVERLVVNVGAGVVVEKSPTEVSKILEDQVLELTAYRQQLIEKMKEIVAAVEDIQKNL